MTDVYRTPDDRFEGLPDFPFAPCYREAAGLRLAHLDEGEGTPVVFFHGEPTWSYLWRKVLLPVRDAGFRCVVPDLAGFGRSDKPTDVGLVLLRPPHRADGGPPGATWTCATPPSSSTTGVGRSGSGSRSSTRTASRSWW